MLKQTIAKWLGVACDEPNIKLIIRDQLGLVFDVVEIEDMSEEEQREYLEAAHQLWENKFFHLWLNKTKQNQTDAVMEHADTEHKLFGGRIHLFLVDFLKDEARKYNDRWAETQISQELPPDQKYSAI